ncbi:MAG: sugar transferase [Candidatus Omnitrophica bacterium]|nr:sugar transferase [Candidatus Omnitrophota bacterium]
MSLQEIVKRALDYALALMGAFFFFPFACLFAFAILLEDGFPVFFQQERIGKGGVIFQSYKFRSMIKNAEDKLGPVQARLDDPRITKVGKFLRHTAMDELPQLINILKGDMSFVGPRPLRPHEIEVEGDGTRHDITASDLFKRRCAVKPGLTGVAQVCARRTIPHKKKIRYDLWYVRHQSLILDSRLILQSAWISLNSRWDRLGKPR